MRGPVSFVVACVVALASCVAVAQVPDDWTPLVLPAPAPVPAPAGDSAAPRGASPVQDAPEALPEDQPAAQGGRTVLPSFGARPSAEEIGPRPDNAPVRRRFRLLEPGAAADEGQRRPPVEEGTLPPEPEPWVPLVPEAQAAGEKPWVPLVPEAAPQAPAQQAKPGKSAKPGKPARKEKRERKTQQPEGKAATPRTPWPAPKPGEEPWVPLVPAP